MSAGEAGMLPQPETENDSVRGLVRSPEEAQVPGRAVAGNCLSDLGLWYPKSYPGIAWQVDPGTLAAKKRERKKREKKRARPGRVFDHDWDANGPRMGR